LKFELNLEANLHQLHDDILYRRYEQRPSVAFIVENSVKFYLQHYSKGGVFMGVVIYPFHTVIGRRIMKSYYAAAPEKKDLPCKSKNIIPVLN
jgi:hypothetical protein